MQCEIIEVQRGEREKYKIHVQYIKPNKAVKIVEVISVLKWSLYKWSVLYKVTKYYNNNHIINDQIII